MALRVVWTEAAASDLEAAANFIERDSRRYASVLVHEARLSSNSLTTLSQRGRIVPETKRPDIRELFVCNYRLIYRITPGAIIILGFIHGSRDLWKLWKNKKI